MFPPTIQPGTKDRQWRVRVENAPQKSGVGDRIHQLLRRFPLPRLTRLGRHLTTEGFEIDRRFESTCKPPQFPEAPLPWAAPLHAHLAGMRYGHPTEEQAETQVLTIRNGMLVGNGMPLTARGKIPDIRTSAAYFSHETALHTMPYAGMAERFHGNLLALTGNCAFNYFHFMLEHLPRLAVARNHGMVFDAVYAQVDAPFQRDALEMAGVIGKTIAYEAKRKIRANLVMVPSMPNDHCMPTNLALDYLASLAGPYTSGRSQFRRIFIPRRNTSVRRLRNWQQVQSVLEPYGFEVNDLDNLTVPQQASLFAECEAIVAPHGAALTNLAFCQPGTKVIEIMSPGHVFWSYGHISSAKGLVYTALETEESQQWATETECCHADMVLSAGQMDKLKDWLRHFLTIP